VPAVGPITFASRLVAALLFLTFVIGQAPHTVHHLFDPEYLGDECPFATAGERLPGVDADAVGLDHGLAWELSQHQPALLRLPEAVVPGPVARAPPLPASSLASRSSPRF